MKVSFANLERYILCGSGSHQAVVFDARSPNQTLQQTDGLVVATSANAVFNHYVRGAAICFHHKVQLYGALNLKLFSLIGEDLDLYAELRWSTKSW